MDLEEGLQMLINQVVASNLTTAYYLHLHNGISSKQCTLDVLKTWLALSDITNKKYYDELKKMGEA
jgi:hypothetical protein